MIRIILFITFIFSTSFAGLPPTTLKGQSESGKTTTFNFEAPYNQATTTGSSTRLVETGNNNLLLNASFEHSTPATSWTLGSGVSSAVETTEVKDGKKALTLTLTAATGDILCQNVTPTIKLQGSNMEHALRVKTTLTTLQVCAQNAGSTVGTCANVAPDDISKIYNSIVPGPSSGSVGVCLRATGSTSGTVTVDDGYTGYARNIAFGAPPNTFTAKVSSTGVVSDETGGNWINGNCTQSAGNFDCSFSTSFFTSAPNCVGTLRDSSSADQTMNRISADTVSVSVHTRTGAGTGTSVGFQIECTKTGSDYIQPAITPNNFNFDWKDYTGTITQSSGTLPARTLNYMQFRRDGSKGYFRGKFTFTATGTWSGIIIPTPSGITMSSTSLFPVVKVGLNDVSVSAYEGTANKSTSAFSLWAFGSGGSGIFGAITQAFPFTWASGDTVEWEIGPVDILENGVPWTENQGAPQLVGSVIGDTTVRAEKAAGVTTVDYGTYSATVTAGTNATSVTSPTTCNYMRVGSTVSGSCRISTGCTAGGGVATSLTITPPIATTQATTISGNVGSNIAQESGRVIDSGSNLLMNFACNAKGASVRTIDFKYQVP